MSFCAKQSARITKAFWGSDKGKIVSSKLENRSMALSLGLKPATLFWSGIELPIYRPVRYVCKPDIGHSGRGVVFVDHSTAGENGAVSGSWPRPDEVKLMEEWLDTRSIDWKFWMFGMKVAAVQVIDRVRKLTCFLKEDLTPHPPWRSGSLPYADVMAYIGLPRYYQDMRDGAAAVGRLWGEFIRVDMYDTPGGPKFGEVCVTPSALRGFDPGFDNYLSTWM